LQDSFIAGLAALAVIVTAERKARSPRICVGGARPTRLTVIGGFPFFIFRDPLGSPPESSLSAQRSFAPGLAEFPFFVSWPLPYMNSRVKLARVYKSEIKEIGARLQGDAAILPTRCLLPAGLERGQALSAAA
jgi:hypothetical protein